MKIDLFTKKKRENILDERFGPSFNNQIYSLILRTWGDYGRKEVDKLISTLDTIVVAYTGELVAGFTGYSWVEICYKGHIERILRISLTSVDNNQQRNGLMTRMLAKVVTRAVGDKKTTNFYIGCRTADPIVYGFILKYCRNTFPRLDGAKCPDKFIYLARSVSKIIDPDIYFDPEFLIARRAYRDRPSLLKAKIDLAHKSSLIDPRVSAFFRRSLNYDNGDAFIVISQFDKYLLYSAIKRHLKTLARIS